MADSIHYPQFRKYLNDRGYFKIFSAIEWEEVQIIGKKATLNNYKANIFPDKNFLHDLIFDYQNHWCVIHEDEYNKAKELIK